jgi:hypothetical protein
MQETQECVWCWEEKPLSAFKEDAGYEEMQGQVCKTCVRRQQIMANFKPGKVVPSWV